MVFMILALALCVFSENNAIFISAHEYVHPETGQHITLMGDMHCDIDAAGTLTRIQKDLVLKEAKKRDAFIIAENLEAPAYNPYKWLGFIGVNMVVAYKIMQSKQYIGLLNPLMLTGLIAKLWHDEWQQTQIPSIPAEGHMSTFKKHDLSVKLPLFGHTPLKRLVEDARLQGLNAVSPEFRYHFLTAQYELIKKNNAWPTKLVCSLAQGQHWLIRKMTGNSTRYPLTVTDYWKTQNIVLNKIQSLNESNQAFNDFYQECITHYNSSYITQALRKIEHTKPDCTLRTFAENYTQAHNKEYQEVFNEFRDHNKMLLDALIAHEIAQRGAAQSVFICTGADHTVRLCALLENLGYQSIRAVGENNWKMLNEANALNQTYIEARNLDYIAIDLQKFFMNS